MFNDGSSYHKGTLCYIAHKVSDESKSGSDGKSSQQWHSDDTCVTNRGNDISSLSIEEIYSHRELDDDSSLRSNPTDVDDWCICEECMGDTLD